jgi:hypothetical protein
MVRNLLALSLFAMSQIAPSLYAQTAPAGTAQPAANPVDPGAIQALKDMGAYLQTLKRFQVSTELTGERVLADGQKLEHSATADMDVERPNKLRAVMVSARSERQLFYDGKTVTLWTPAQKYYSTVQFADTLAVLVDRLNDKFGVEVPLSDLFLWGTPAAPLDKIESAMNAGQDFIGKDLCDHYAFREGKIDWQIWITTGPAAAAQARDHQSCRRRAAAIGQSDRLESETDLQGRGVQVHAAQGGDRSRDPSPEDQVEERRHEKRIQKIRPGSADRSRSGRLRHGPGGRGSR